nr:unnamed protein product [Callosobruchus analis]
MTFYSCDFRAKPRVSAVAGRRTYTEDELQAALRDIQSGKLGTRRAAVIYGIPRSTLRNKVYKLALEKERESHLNSSALKLDEEEAMDDDKELSGTEEEKEVEKTLEGPLLSVADLLRFSQSASAVMPPGVAGTPDALRHLLAVAADHPDVAPYLLLTSQRLLAAAAAAGTAPADLSAAASGLLLPDFVRRMAAQPTEDARTNNGESEKVSLVGRPSPSNSVITKVERPRSESDMETDDSPSNVILKIPSFKPTTASGKNGCDQIFRNMAEATGSIVSPSTTTSEPPSPPLPVSGGGISGPKPPTMVVPGGAAPTSLVVKDVKDAIAHTISQKFQQSLIAEPPRRPAPQQADEVAKRGGYTPPLMGGLPPASAGGLSVIKEMGRPPPVYHQQHQQPQHQQNQQQQQQKQGSTTGGKGTRPKRGKYRNYDRDSLVEAVRAVQRGEMSVHRAGSYYGVPHSTLEYKVKERHLMRPRKRDPKPNPVDEKIASLKQNDLRVAQEKSKAAVQMKPVHKFAPTSPNGIKLPLFETAAAGGVGGIGHAGYGAPHFPFWPHPGFPHISAPAFPPPPHAAQEFFASQMMQKLQEETSRTTGAHHQQQQQQHPRATSTPPNGSTAGVMSKLSARQMAESLLEGSASGADGGAGNGSFLDGIIRSSLEQGVPGDKGTAIDRDDSDEGPLAPENMSNKALLDQLCRNSRLTPLSKDDGSSGEEGGGRKASPPLILTGTPAQTQDTTSSSSAGSSRKNDSGAIGAGSSNSGPSEPMDFSEESPSGAGRTDGEERRPRIYLKQDLAKMDNLKPETLVRLREDYVPTQHGGEMLDNGCAMTDSAAGSGCGSDDGGGVSTGGGEHD